MDVTLFSTPSFRNGNVVTLVVGVGEFGIIAALPLWLQFALGYGAFEAGIALVALALGSFVASGTSFSMAASVPGTRPRADRSAPEGRRRGRARLRRGPDTPVVANRPRPLHVRNRRRSRDRPAQVTNIVLVDVPAHSAGQGSGIQSAARELGSALGIAVLTTLGSDPYDRLTGTGLPAPQAQQLSSTVTDSAGSAIPALATTPDQPYRPRSPPHSPNLVMTHQKMGHSGAKVSHF